MKLHINLKAFSLASKLPRLLWKGARVKGDEDCHPYARQSREFICFPQAGQRVALNVSYLFNNTGSNFDFDLYTDKGKGSS